MNLIENTMYQDDIMKIITHPLPWNKLQNKALLISGATGLVGSFLIDVIMLLNREQGLNCKVYSLGRNEDKAKSVIVMNLLYFSLYHTILICRLLEMILEVWTMFSIWLAIHILLPMLQIQ